MVSNDLVMVTPFINNVFAIARDGLAVSTIHKLDTVVRTVIFAASVTIFAASVTIVISDSGTPARNAIRCKTVLLRYDISYKRSYKRPLLQLTR